MVQLKFRPPTLKEKDWIIITNQLLNNAEVTEPAEGMRTEDQLQNHLEVLFFEAILAMRMS